MMLPVRCMFCGGSGFKETADIFGNPERIYCPDCYGTGYLDGMGSASAGTLQMRCISCGGRGSVVTTDCFGNPYSIFCTDCNGTGFLKN